VTAAAGAMRCLDMLKAHEAMDQPVQMKLKFCCPPEYEKLIPQPFPAVLGLPDWHRAMPQKSFSPIARQDTFTLKKCPPFIDAMTYDFLIPLAVDLKVQDGEFSWDFDVPEGFVSEYSRSPFLRGASVSGPVRRLCLRSGGHPDHGGRCADPASGEARTDRSRRKHHRGNGASRHLLTR